MNYKRVLLALIPSLIILGVLIYVWSVTLVFTLANELDVETTSSSTTRVAYNGDTLDLDFKTLIDSPNACSTRCEFILRDVSSNKILFSQITNVGSSLDVSIPYLVNESSDGETYLSYDVACNNLLSAICSTSQEVYYESTFLSIEHTKNEYQVEQETSVRSFLESAMQGLQSIDVVSNESFYVLSQLNMSTIETDDLDTSLASIENKKDSFAARVQSIIFQWNEGKYLEISLDELRVLEEDIASTQEDVLLLKNKSFSLLLTYNQTIQKLNSIFDERDMLSYLESYQLENSFFIDVVQFNMEVEKVYKTIHMKNVLSLVEVHDKVDSLFSQLASLQSAYVAVDRSARSSVHNTTYLWYGENISSISAACSVLDESLQSIELHNSNAYALLQENYANELSNASFNASLEAYALAVYQNQTSNYTMSYPYEDIAPYHSNWTADINYLKNKFCFENMTAIKLSSLPLIHLNNLNQEIRLFSLPDPQEIFCIYGECSLVEEKTHYPLIMVHGHALTSVTSAEAALHSFSKIQHELEADGYVNVGELNDYPTTSWTSIPAPLSIRVSYYYLPVSELGQYQFYTKKYESIENYAIRLKELVEEVKVKTGEEKVIILAHSMGGLVTRKYLSIFGDDSVEKAILVGTPNDGVIGASKSLCSLTGANKECEEMTQGSLFLTRLNTYAPTKTKIYTIAGIGCPKDGFQGDGVVNLKSVQLDYANNSIVEGVCTDALQSSLHQDLINPDLYPEVLELIRVILDE